MGKFQYSKSEKEFNRVLKYQDDTLNSMHSLEDDLIALNDNISSSEKLLAELGLSDRANGLKSDLTNPKAPKKKLTIHSWEEILKSTKGTINTDVELESFFTDEELKSNERYITQLRSEFNTLHKLDPIDYSICITAGVLASAVDIFLVGIPQKTKEGIQAGPLSNYIRQKFDEAIPSEKIKELEKKFKVPYDPSTNHNLNEYVDGLSSWFHRYHSLGHDPILGFIFGVFDIMTGRFTAIDKSGKIISQVVGDVPEGMNIFKAIAQVFGHLQSDVNTSMGLPVPLMTLFNKFQFGSIGPDNLSIAEVARGMYAQGYDFKHFCSMSIPTMIIEVVVRFLYCVKRLSEGHTLKDSIPVNIINRRMPKLQTMLFISHSICTGVNGGKVYFTQNPLAINYTEWMAFAKYSISQMKWTLIEKPDLRNKYVDEKLSEDWASLQRVMNESWAIMQKDYLILK
ncbi:hypothetical protein Q75_14785 [Bacillus coahuilensis p1.1.43]|uniref:Uncharacterized protein n=1 Tax=Bacillus coahuilensis p1.1.43 TaxID=1150625 RepID=A0A147K553_9BACI|nr:hypothetical protein [Bacillus coahuilensis]KUP04710.1 hypothetical protein Q75_14785 [Bacillus coahuilensis p1.1.43]